MAGYTRSQALSQLGIAMGMTFPLLFLPITLVGALSTALIPELSTLIEQKKQEALIRQIKSALMFSLSIAFLFVPVYIGLGTALGDFLFNNSTSGIYLANSAWIMVPLSLSGITASILNSLGLEIKSFKNYILGSIILIASLLFLPKYIGIKALILGMGVCMTVVTALNLRMINKENPLHLNLFKPIVLMSIFLIPTSMLAKWSYTVFYFLFPNFLAIGFSMGITMLLFIMLCLIFNIINLNVWFLKIKKLKRRKNKKKDTCAVSIKSYF